MVERPDGEQIDILIPQKMIHWRKMPILLPTSSGKFRIGIVNDQGAFLEIRNHELSEQLARQLINILFQKRKLLDEQEE